MTDPQLMLVFNGTIAERFEAFHRENPHVYRAGSVRPLPRR